MPPERPHLISLPSGGLFDRTRRTSLARAASSRLAHALAPDFGSFRKKRVSPRWLQVRLDEFEVLIVPQRSRTVVRHGPEEGKLRRPRVSTEPLTRWAEQLAQADEVAEQEVAEALFALLGDDGEQLATENGSGEGLPVHPRRARYVPRPPLKRPRAPERSAGGRFVARKNPRRDGGEGPGRPPPLGPGAGAGRGNGVGPEGPTTSGVWGYVPSRLPFRRCASHVKVAHFIAWHQQVRSQAWVPVHPARPCPRLMVSRCSAGPGSGDAAPGGDSASAGSGITSGASSSPATSSSRRTWWRRRKTGRGGPI